MKSAVVLHELGADYHIRVVDKERVVYRDFGTFDVEISGLDTHLVGCTIYVWEKCPVLQIAEVHTVNSLDALKTTLAGIERLRG